MTQRPVRFTPSFFERLDELLPDTRPGDGSPSATDFLLHELPAVRDMLAADFEARTIVVPPGGEVRIYVGTGVLVRRFALFAVLAFDGAVEILDLEIE